MRLNVGFFTGLITVLFTTFLAVSVCGVFLRTEVSLAAETNDFASRLTLSPELQRGDINNPQGFWPMLGIGAGVMGKSENIRTGGVPGNVRLMGSYYFETVPWVADAGAGVHNQFLTQAGPGNDTVQSLYTQVSARYRTENRWQVGGVWNTLVDNPDRYRSNTNNLASFAGIQLLKEFTWDSRYLVRAGGRAMTDIGISGGSVNMFMAELEVSFGNTAQVAAAQPKQPAAEPQAVAPHLATRAFQSFKLDPRNVNFESDSTQVVADSKAYLKRLSALLAQNQHLFDRVEIVGHTDQRGPDRYNLTLSEKRAQTIAKGFMAAGLKPSQVKVYGRGKYDNLVQGTSAEALQLNRRVELRFQGVKNQVALQSLINAIGQSALQVQ